MQDQQQQNSRPPLLQRAFSGRRNKQESSRRESGMKKEGSGRRNGLFSSFRRMNRSKKGEELTKNDSSKELQVVKKSVDTDSVVDDTKPATEQLQTIQSMNSADTTDTTSTTGATMSTPRASNNTTTTTEAPKEATPDDTAPEERPSLAAVAKKDQTVSSRFRETFEKTEAEFEKGLASFYEEEQHHHLEAEAQEDAPPQVLPEDAPGAGGADGPLRLDSSDDMDLPDLQHDLAQAEEDFAWTKANNEEAAAMDMTESSAQLESIREEDDDEVVALAAPVVVTPSDDNKAEPTIEEEDEDDDAAESATDDLADLQLELAEAEQEDDEQAEEAPQPASMDEDTTTIGAGKEDQPAETTIGARKEEPAELLSTAQVAAAVGESEDDNQENGAEGQGDNDASPDSALRVGAAVGEATPSCVDDDDDDDETSPVEESQRIEEQVMAQKEVEEEPAVVVAAAGTEVGMEQTDDAVAAQVDEGEQEQPGMETAVDAPGGEAGEATNAASDHQAVDRDEKTTDNRDDDDVVVVDQDEKTTDNRDDDDAVVVDQDVKTTDNRDDDDANAVEALTPALPSDEDGVLPQNEPKEEEEVEQKEKEVETEELQTNRAAPLIDDVGETTVEAVLKEAAADGAGEDGIADDVDKDSAFSRTPFVVAAVAVSSLAFMFWHHARIREASA